MRSRTFLFFVLALILTCLVLSACGTTTTTSAATTTGATTATTGATAATAATTSNTGAVANVALGAAGPFTGALSKIGVDALNALKMAVEEFDAANPTIKVSVSEGDDAADPAKAAAVAQKFTSDAAVVGVVGPMTSACIQACEPVLEAGKLSLITQSGTNDKLSQQGFTIFHRICPVDSEQGSGVAGILAVELKAKKIYIVDDTGTYGKGLGDQVQQILTTKYSIPAANIARAEVTPDDKDFSALLTKIKAFAPDAFFGAVASPAQFAAIAKQMQQMNYKVQLVTADLVDKGELIDNAAGATEGTWLTKTGPLLEVSPVPAALDFVKKFVAKYSVLSMYSGATYEAANVMLDAFKRAYQANGGKITREGVTDALKTTNYTGLYGIPLQFKANGDLKASAVFILKVQNGNFVQVKSADY